MPAALAVTAGIVLDRCAPVPLTVSLSAAILCLLAWLLAAVSGRSGLPLVYLSMAGLALGAAHHHFRRVAYPDDLSHFAPEAAQEWCLVQLRGTVDEEPRRTPQTRPDPLRSRARSESASTVVAATELQRDGAWVPVSGRAQVVGTGGLPELHVGDEVEIVGRLARFGGPVNPGGFDSAELWHDRDVHSQVLVRQGPTGVTRLNRGWPTSWRGVLGVVRGWGQDILIRELSPRSGGVAAALLLGEGAPMTADDWEKYKRTGVIHVLAISGQHLVVIAGALWWVLRRLGVRQRHGALFVALVLLVYALLTGGRPSAMRAAVTVGTVCLAIVARRRTLPANLFALSWLVVAILSPTDITDQGCLLSFLCVAVLYWGANRLSDQDQEDDPLQEIIDASRPAWLRGLRWLVRSVGASYAIGVLMWVAIAPLLAYRTNSIPTIGLILGPPLTLFAGLALFCGFALLACAALHLPFTFIPARCVDGLLWACERLVDLADSWETQVYVPDVPGWWIWIYYILLLGVLTQRPFLTRWPWAVVAGLGWLCVGLLSGAARLSDDELRCTFLAVGHGGCTVIEADGRTLLYDAGAINGPDVTRRHIAPFLWSRGIRRVDEVFLSHADLDHFNGLRDLLKRFAVGQVTTTPTFAERNNAAVKETLSALSSAGVPLRIVKVGDRLTLGAVGLEVLHPPAAGPDGPENVRSLVLRVRHGTNTMLLTGDLEGVGMAQVLRLPPEPVTVLMAPHHGSHLVDGAGLAKWCRPRLVVACQGPRPGPPRAPALYTGGGARFLTTHEHGAITVRSHASGVVVETFATKERFVLRGTPAAK